MLTSVTQVCTQVLNQYGVHAQEAEELLLYNQSAFAPVTLNEVQGLFSQGAIAPEPHIETWQHYERESKIRGVAAVLKQQLNQLQFPIQAGIGETAAYQAATRRGLSPQALATSNWDIFQEGCKFHAPDQLRLDIHLSLAGPIPVITAGCRDDFAMLVQALTRRNEPCPISPAMGACMVSGYNNWERIHRYRQEWHDRWFGKHHAHPSDADWNVEFTKLLPQKDRYQDRFIILSPGPYSNVSAAELGLSDAQWNSYSHCIRLEHECTHYFTLRLFKSMRNYALDELIADYRGIVAAIGHYRADWFLRFMGLESYPVYRQGGRLDQYRGNPALSDRAFQALQHLVKRAAENLEQFDQQYLRSTLDPRADAAIAIALTQLTLIELAAESGVTHLASVVDRVEREMAHAQSMAYGSAERRNL